MAKIVIAGAGPVGLFLAIMLHKNGFTDLLLCDPRLGNYTRTGHVTHNTVQLIQTLCDISWENAPYVSIKSIEKKLYQKVKSLGISCTHEPFINLIKSPRGALIGTSTVACDWVLDCTGVKRNVLHAFNQLPDIRQSFEINTDFLPFFKDHMIVAIRFPHEIQNEVLADINHLFWDMETNYLQPEWASAFLSTHLPALQSLGWHGYKLPQCYSSPPDKHQVTRLYLQYPEGLKPEKYVQWLNAVLTSYLGTLPDYTIYSCKKSPTGFEVFSLNLKNTAPAMMQQSAYPGVGMLGDALINYDYRFGNGIARSIKIIMSSFLPYFKKTPFDVKKYNTNTKKILQKVRHQLINREDKEYSLDIFFEKYLTISEKSLAFPPQLRAHALIQQINNCINEKSCFYATQKEKVTHPVNTLDYLVTSLSEVRNRFNSHHSEMIKPIDQSLLYWNTIFHDKANEAMKNQCWFLAKTLYTLSLNVCITLKITTADTLLPLVSQCIRSLILLGQDKNRYYKKALDFGRAFLPLIPGDTKLTQVAIDELNTLLNNLLLAWFLRNKKTTPEKQMQFLALCLRFKAHWREGIAHQLIRLGLLPPEQNKKKHFFDDPHLRIF